LVTSAFNEIRVDYPFVDLLKPEESAVVPMLLALERTVPTGTSKPQEGTAQAWGSETC
jgi:hypothetical protein